MSGSSPRVFIDTVVVVVIVLDVVVFVRFWVDAILHDFPRDAVFGIAGDFAIDDAGQKAAQQIAGEINAGGNPRLLKQRRRGGAKIKAVSGQDGAHRTRRIHTRARDGTEGVEGDSHCNGVGMMEKKLTRGRKTNKEKEAKEKQMKKRKQKKNVIFKKVKEKKKERRKEEKGK